VRVSVIGQGYVGQTISAAALAAGHDLIGIDLSEDVVKNLSLGLSHVEGINQSEFASAISSGKFRVANNYELVDGSDVVVIAVPTPLNDKGEPDLSPLISAVKSLRVVLKRPTLIINESTSHPGTLREIIKPLIEAESSLKHGYAVSPERVDPGNLKFGTKNTPRVVGALTDEARDAAVAFYRTFCDVVFPVSSAEVAEAAKLFENTFRFINIGLVNEFSQIMGAMGIPVDEVLKAAGTKPYGFMPFHPNVGIGGHCIPVDPLYLQARAAEFGLTSKYIAVSEEVNHAMPKYMVERLVDECGGLKGKKVLVVGVSYKADIADTRETPAEPFVHHLREFGADVSWHDPIVNSWNGETSRPISGDYDVAVVLVAHSALNMDGWNGEPIFTINSHPNFPEWKPLLSARPKS
jgi:UDP-N-acetyl-D-glucosamine dehydrogenase